MPRRLESVMRIGRRIGLSDDKGVVVAVFLALIVVASVVAGYYLVLRPQPEPYNTISLLDENKGMDYPEVLVANQNSTFSVCVEVANHMNTEQSYRVQTKVTQSLPATFPEGLQIEPVDSYDFSLANGESNQQLVTVTQNEAGSYSVVFELYRLEAGSYVFTQNYCVLNIQVVS